MLINAIYTTVGHMEYSCVLNYLFKYNLCFEINLQLLQQDDD
jgi:hypothetical protein